MSDRDKLKIILGTREIVVESATYIKTMDTGADACSAVMPWEPGRDSVIDKITAPYSYSNAQIYIGDELQSEMVLYDVTHKTTSSGTSKDLEMFSKIADIIDSTVRPPYEMNKVKLTDRCKQQCEPYGISVVVGDDAAEELHKKRKVSQTIGYRAKSITLSTGEVMYSEYKTIPIKKSKLVTDEKKFPRVKAEPTDTVWEHLAKLAAQRGLILSCTKYGDLLITTANENSRIVGSIEEGQTSLSSEYQAIFSGRNRFNSYKAIVKSSGSSRASKTQKAFDPVVQRPRLLTFNADDDIPGEAKSAAEWRKNKSAADAMSISFPVNSWYAPDNTLWQPNTRVIIKSKTIGTEKKGFTFLITRVEFKYSASGTSAILELKPPTVYTTGEIEEPWSE
jgi:prophage tail gpP-like protein